MIEINASTVAEAVNQINKIRLQNKDKWVFLTAIVNGIKFKFKFYNTWIQIAEFGGLRDSSCMNISVKQFKNYLTEFFSQ